jgi:hypothetical protein
MESKNTDVETTAQQGIMNMPMSRQLEDFIGKVGEAKQKKATRLRKRRNRGNDSE